MICSLKTVLCSSFIQNNLRRYSSINKKKIVDTSTDDNTGIITLTLNKPPVNSLSLELLKQLHQALEDLEKSRPKCVIITSFSDKVFSAGLDLQELYKPNEGRLRMFWRALQDTIIKFYKFPYPTVAVINGHAPAGGCLLSLCCDYRIMVNDFSIGLNEVAVGITVPPWLAVIMQNVIGKRNAELALITGRLFKTNEAYDVGLIDAIVPNKSEALNKAIEFYKVHNIVNFVTRTNTKDYIRSSTVEFMKEIQEDDIEKNVTAFMKPEFQRHLEVYFNKIKNK